MRLVDEAPSARAAPAEPKAPAGRADPKRTLTATVAVLRRGEDRGLCAMEVQDPQGCLSGDYFVPFEVSGDAAGVASAHAYAGLSAALDKLRALRIRSVVVQSDDEALIAELERRRQPDPRLALPYIILGCKLNEFARAKVIGVPAWRLEKLRAKAAGVAATLRRSAEPAAAPRLLQGADAVGGGAKWGQRAS